MDLQLTGKRALVTGGSRGIGKATAAALIAEGATVTITARGASALHQAAAQLGAHAVTVDTGDDDLVKSMLTQAVAAMGGVDILVNAAATPGGQSRPPTLAEITTEAFWADVNVKVMGYLRCAQAVAPAMVARGWGRIVNVSGLAARSTGSTIGSIRNVAVAAMTKEPRRRTRTVRDQRHPGTPVDGRHRGHPGHVRGPGPRRGRRPPGHRRTIRGNDNHRAHGHRSGHRDDNRLPRVAIVVGHQRGRDRLRRRPTRCHPLLTRSAQTARLTVA